MKRIFLVFMSLMFIMCLAGCGEKEDKINIDFIIDGKSYLVEIDKGTSLSRDIIPLSNDEEVVELYYDENMKNKYNDEKIENDIKIFVKKISNKSIENELKNYVAQFDINDKKILWDGDARDDFQTDCILIIFRKTSTYPEFKLEYLDIEEAISFEYIEGPVPPKYLYEEEHKHLLEKFRQSIAVYLISQSKEEVVELIRKLEKIEFIKVVSPNINSDVGV